ncbi:MAG TPA: BTAD domain-containing putative transcriptional regulator [Longimicrobium sp.]|jgi:non-specific serine/threonine protein kinase
MSAPPLQAPASAHPETALPVQLSTLVGREAETAEVRRLLEGTRMLTLTGAGGSGKTRLALEVAGQVAREGSRSVAWVELAPLSAPALLAQHVAVAIGLPAAQGTVDALAAALQGQPTLLVLDNCEHLVDACAVLAEELLRRCPELSILATSREALAVSGERAWLVPALSLPHERHTVADDVGASIAVQLFVERACDAVAGFRLTDENAAAVAEVCRRLDGLPLGIELAASWVRVLTPRQIADRLGDALRLLTGGRRTALPRQQTLRAAMDWSYGLLSDGEQRLLQRFSVFAGSFTVEAAEAVCADERIEPFDVLDLLSSLVDKSLVGMREQDGAARYRLLEVVRQYAAERLRTEDDEVRVRARHVQYFLRLAEELGPRMGTADQRAALDRLELEHDNLRAALRWSLDQADAESAARIAVPAWGYWSTRGSTGEGERWLREVRAAGVIADPLLRARLLFVAGTAAGMRAAWDEAEPIFLECLDLYRTLDRPDMVARTLARLSSAAAGRDEFERAAEWIEESWEVARQVGDPVRMSEILNSRGRVAHARGDLDAAAESYAMGARLAREAGIPGVSAVVSNLGIVEYDRGNLAGARDLFLQSLAHAREHRIGRGATYPLSSLALVLARDGDPARAVPLFGAVESLFTGFAAYLHPRDRPRYQQGLAEARVKVDPEVWAEAWQRGEAMTMGEAIDYAFAMYPAPIAPDAPEPRTAEAPPADAPPEILRVLTLGGFQVIHKGEPMSAAEWVHARPRELMLYLLCHPQGRTRDQIGLVFWPDSSAAQVKNSFHVTLHRLRKIVDRPDLVVQENERYRINPELRVFFDAAAFEREVPSALRELESGPDAVARLESALALYRGDFLEGESVGDWHLSFHDRLRRLYVDALSALADAQMRRAEYARASETLERLVLKEDLDEDAHRRLMTALAHAGRRDRAMRHYERLTTLLRRELDAEPEEETILLFDEIRGGGVPLPA